MTTREKLLSELNNLSDEQLENVLTFVEVLKTQSPRPEYDESKDPAIGFFSAAPDLSSRTKDILRAEIGQRIRGEKQKF